MSEYDVVIKAAFIYLFHELYKNNIIKSKNIYCDRVSWYEIKHKLMHVVKSIANKKMIILSNTYGNSCVVNNISFSYNNMYFPLSFSCNYSILKRGIKGFCYNYLDNEILTATFYRSSFNIVFNFNCNFGYNGYAIISTNSVDIKKSVDEIANSIFNFPNQINTLFEYLYYIKNKIYGKNSSEIKINLYDIFLALRSYSIDYIEQNNETEITIKLFNIINNVFDNNDVNVLRQIELEYCLTDFKDSYNICNVNENLHKAILKAFSDNGIVFDESYNLISNSSKNLIYNMEVTDNEQ